MQIKNRAYISAILSSECNIGCVALLPALHVLLFHVLQFGMSISRTENGSWVQWVTRVKSRSVLTYDDLSAITGRPNN